MKDPKAIEKGAFGSPSTIVANFLKIYISIYIFKHTVIFKSSSQQIWDSLSMAFVTNMLNSTEREREREREREGGEGEGERESLNKCDKSGIFLFYCRFFDSFQLVSTLVYRKEKMTKQRHFDQTTFFIIIEYVTLKVHYLSIYLSWSAMSPSNAFVMRL